MSVCVAQAHAHVPRSPLCKRNAWHSSAGLGIFKSAPVLDLEAEHNFAIGIQWPDVSLLDIFLGRNAPDGRGH